MADKVISSSTTLGYTLKLEMDETINVEANTSRIDWALVLYSTGYNFAQYACGWEVTLGGETVSSCARSVAPQISVAKNSSVRIANGSYTITHENDGTKTITCTAETDIAGNPAPGDQSLSGSWVLTSIPRESTMTIPTITIGSSATFTISRNSSSYTHTLNYSFKGTTGTIGTNIGTSVSWTPSSNTFLPLLPNATSGEITFTLITYSGTTEIGRKTYTGTLNVSATVVPKNLLVGKAPYNTNAWINTKNVYVQGFSAIQISPSFDPGQGATVADAIITGDVNGRCAEGGTFRSGIITKSGTLNFQVTATDSRGRTKAASPDSVSVLAYTAPKVSVSYARGTYSGGSWTPSDDGDHIKVAFSVSISLSSLSNTCTGVVACEDQTSQSVSGTSGTVYFIGTDNSHSYAVSVTITDSVGTTSKKSLTVPTVQDPMNINTSLPGIGIGKVASTAELVDSDWAFLAPGFKTGASSGLFASSGHAQMADLIENVTGSDIASYTLPEASGQTMFFSASGSITLTVPSGTPTGWKCTCINARAASTMTFNRSGSDQFYVKGESGLSTSFTASSGYDTVQIIRTSSTRLVLIGGLSGGGGGGGGSVAWSDITGKPNVQVTDNLVTSVSSSSTHSEYPSAKLFYDTIGDIESLLSALR